MGVENQNQNSEKSRAEHRGVPSPESKATSELKADFTPKPWTKLAVAHTAGNYSIYGPHRELLADVFGSDANANLFFAAPALYEALAALLAHLRTHHDSPPCQYLANANAALDLAGSQHTETGETS